MFWLMQHHRSAVEKREFSVPKDGRASAGAAGLRSDGPAPTGLTLLESAPKATRGLMAEGAD